MYSYIFNTVSECSFDQCDLEGNFSSVGHIFSLAKIARGELFIRDQHFQKYSFHLFSNIFCIKGCPTSLFFLLSSSLSQYVDRLFDSKVVTLTHHNFMVVRGEFSISKT